MSFRIINTVVMLCYFYSVYLCNNWGQRDHLRGLSGPTMC